tara:strand:+ start:210 stop:695 length:486 start_codon:yes stop_codon:yes gene_type:complete
MSKNSQHEPPPPYDYNNYYSSSYSGNIPRGPYIYTGYDSRQYFSKIKEKRIKERKQVNYHGPVINSVSSVKKCIHVTKKYQGKEISSTYLPYPENFSIPCFTGVDNRVAIPGANMVPFIVTNSNQMSEYFREQERLMKNRHQDEILRLEAQKVYTNIIRKY